MREGLAALLVFFALSVAPISAQESHGPLEVNAAVHHDVSPPLRGLSPSAPGAEHLRERPLRPIPQNVIATNAPDPVVQASAGSAATTTSSANFAGVGQ